MSDVRSPTATLPRHKLAPVLERSACRSPTPADGTRTRFLQTFEPQPRDCPDGGRDKAHVRGPFSIAQAPGARRFLQAITARAEIRRKRQALEPRENISL